MQLLSNRRALLIPAVALPLVAAVAVGSAHAQVFRDQTRPDNIGASAFQFRVGQPGAMIKVHWGRPERVPSSTMLGYVIWRDDFQNNIVPVGGRDGDTSRGFVDTEAGRNPTGYNGVPGSDAAGTRGQLGQVAGLAPGQVYRYSVSAAYNNGLQDRDGDGMPDIGAQFMSPTSNFSRRVTAIAPPSITGVNGQTPSGTVVEVDLNSIQVDWQQPPGADTYVIWVSGDPSFRKGGKQVFETEKTVPINLGGPTTATATLSVNAAGPGRRLAGRKGKRVKPTASGSLFISVGARRSGDPKPRPFGAIFSAPVQVRAIDAPPPNPS
jgi:hypothetical protein